MYTRPPAPVANTWPTAESAQGQRIASETEWRAFFPDPRLQSLILTALENNRDLRIALARVGEARAQYGIVRADRFPTVNLGTSRNAALTPADLGGANQSVTGERYDFSMNMISYEVDLWGRLSGLAESSKASYLATEEARRSIRLSLIAEVANAYFGILELEERARLARATVAAREHALSLVEKGRQAGFASNLDYLQASGVLETARADLAVLDRERAAAHNLLQSLLGAPMPEDLPPGRTLEDQDVDGNLAAGVPAEVLLSRPDVIAAEQRLIASNANVGAARAAFLPKILLTGVFGTASRALSGLFMAGSKAWAFQPSLSMPLFDGGRTAANADVAEARKVIAVAEYEKIIQQAFREVADLLASRTALAAQRRAAEANLKAQQERLRIAQILFQSGKISFLDVLDAQRESYAAQQTAVQVRRNQLTTAAQLYKALGGGSS